jgi:hypothetical protein
LYFYFANSGIFITTKEIFESSLPPEYEINKNVIELKLGDIIKVEDLIKNITSHNYLYSLSL